MSQSNKVEFFSESKIRKEKFLFISMSIILIVGILVIFIDTCFPRFRSSSHHKIYIIYIMMPFIILINVSILRSLRYKSLRIIITQGKCCIFSEDKLLFPIGVKEYKISYYRRGGLKVIFAPSVSAKERFRLAYHFHHLFGVCIWQIVLSNDLFPDIDKVAKLYDRGNSA